MKRVIAFSLVLVMLAAALVGCAEKKATVTVNVEQDGAVVLTKQYEVTLPANDAEALSVESVIVENAEELGAILEDSDYGKYVIGMNGYIADDAKQEYWAILVNGEMAMTGLRDTRVADGDVYTFQLATY